MNIAEILKYCPKGTNLYSPVFGKVTLQGVDSMLKILLKDGSIREFYPNGNYSQYGECVLFPSKGQRDWNKFRLPVKRGDIMMEVDGKYPFIANGKITPQYFPDAICGITDKGNFIRDEHEGHWTSEFYIPASEEAKKELFDKMAEAGYRWNADTLELEKIEPKFKEGDVLVDKYSRLTLYTGVINSNRVQTCADLCKGNLIPYQPLFYDEPASALKLANKEERNKLYSGLVRNGYKYDKEQHKLIKQEFKPYDKVLGRGDMYMTWIPDTFSCYNQEDDKYPYICLGNYYSQCIPYEGNEYLVGTTDSPE